jgi:hypothetical protein
LHCIKSRHQFRGTCGVDKLHGHQDAIHAHCLVCSVQAQS